MTIRDRIETLAAQVGLTFNYGRRYDHNINADSLEFPALLMIEPDDVGFYYSSLTGGIVDYDNVFLQFVDLFEMGNQAQTNYAAKRAMRDKAAQFIDLIISDDYLNTTSTNGTVKVPGIIINDYLDANVVGIEINMNLQLTNPYACLN